MSESSESLRRKIASAGDLRSVVRTMKAMAASGIGQYEKSAQALADYFRIVELGLSACFRTRGLPTPGRGGEDRKRPARLGAIVFGSDQGLVGRFNEDVAEYAIHSLSNLAGEPRICAVGERVHALLSDAGLPPRRLFAVPNSVQAITPLVARLQIESGSDLGGGEDARIHLFHNRPQPGGRYEPSGRLLLPLDVAWLQEVSQVSWPTSTPPQIIGSGDVPELALIREYLFISLFRACAESLASENACRLAAMERADKNIGELLDGLRATFHRLRQGGIDEELFDVSSGFEALMEEP